MRFRSQTWWLLCLLFLLAGGYVWHRANEYETHRAAATANAKAALAPHAKRLTPAIASAPFPILSPALNSTAAQSNTLVTAKDDRFRFRLANTPKTVGQLTRDSRALLLENALIDTASGQPLNVPKELRADAEPGAYIVQARGAVDKNFRDDLAAAGAEIVSYIPNNAYLVTATAGAARKIAASSGAQFVTPYEPYFKLKTDVLKLALAGESIAGTNALQTLVFPGQRDATLAALRTLGAEVLADETSGLGTILTVRPASASLAALARLPGARTIQLVKPRKPMNDLARVRLGVTTNTTDGATNNYLGLTGNNVWVNVNDFGFDSTHPDLTPRLVEDPSNLPLATDTDGHGTHVTGIIISSGVNSLNIGTNASGSVTGADFRGKAPSAKVFGINLRNGAHTDTYIQEKTASTNIFISNNSWGVIGENGYDLTAASYDAAVRDALPGVPGSQSLLYVFAAGNDGLGDENGTGGVADSLSSPATAKNVVAVGAIESLRNITDVVTNLPGYGTNEVQVFINGSDSDKQVAWYSSRGNVGVGVEGTAGRFKPDVVAPGSWIVSTASSTWDQQTYFDSRSYNTYYNLDDLIAPFDQFAYGFFAPANTVRMDIDLYPNDNSTTPFPDFPIYVSQSDIPTNGTPVGTNHISLNFPPYTDSSDVFFTVGNPYAVTNHYSIFLTLVISNDYGNYFQVLSNLSARLAPNYRYESGTSMAAPAVSGMFALMQEYFEKATTTHPSPALMKALLINGARSVDSDVYDLQTQPPINYQGWGLANLTNTLPATLSNSLAGTVGTAGSMLVFDQNPTNALATGQSATRTVSLTNAARLQPLRVTLTWTDPPGDPNAAIKLVNNLDLVVTNLDTGAVYLGNDIISSREFNLPAPTNAYTFGTNGDVINNVENVYLKNPLGTNYSITVIGRRVNVNAVTAHTNDFVQDYALVISSGNGSLSNALTLSNAAPAVNVTVTQPLVTPFAGALSNGIPLLQQHVGGNAPLLGTTNGMTNQWHFYVLTNDTAYTNVAILTFSPPELSMTRIGTRGTDPNDISRLEADIDLYVSTDPGLLNLDPTAIANADVSQSRPGSEVVVYTNSSQNTVYYIGVKSEDSLGAEYGLFGVSSEFPFDETDANGNHILHGKPASIAIPDGTPSAPQGATIFAIATSSYKARRVVVTNNITHELMGDLLGDLQHDGHHVVLNNHTAGNGSTNQTFIYDDLNEGDIVGAQHTDGPGTLRTFSGKQSAGAWQLTMIDNAATHIGTNGLLTLFIEKENETNDYTGNIVAGGTFYGFFEVPPEATNLTIFVEGTTQPVDVWVGRNYFPDANFNDFNATYNPPGGSMVIDRYSTPPLSPGFYVVAVHNAGNTGTPFHLYAKILPDINAVNTLEFGSSGPMALLDDAVTNSIVSVTNSTATNRIYSVDVGVRLDHPRESDLTLTLVSPHGTRVLLAEERGRDDNGGYGGGGFTTNAAPPASAGDFNATTNVIAIGQNYGKLLMSYQFYSIPDRMVVYYDGDVIYDTGLVSGAREFTLDFGPGAATDLIIVMNPDGNPDPGTRWDYQATVVTGTESLFAFTENTNKAVLPMKFYPPPFRGTAPTNLFNSTFESLAAGDYAVPSVLEGWNLLAGGATVVTNPVSQGTNALAFHVSTLARSVTTTPGHKYRFSFAYRQNTNGILVGPRTYDSHTYYLLETNSWTASESLATQFGGHLAAITNLAENVFVFNTFAGADRALWFGGNDVAAPGTFVWTSGEPFGYANWDSANGEPNNYLGLERYVAVFPPNDLLGRAGFWNDADDLNTANADGVSVQPTYGVVEIPGLVTSGVGVSISGTTIATIVATANSWQRYSTNFTASQANSLITLQGLASGAVLDSVSLLDLGLDAAALPEESLDKLKGEVAYGDWKLEVWDKRVGATNPEPVLQSWKLSFILDNTVPLPVPALQPSFVLDLLVTNLDELTTLTYTNVAVAAYGTNTLTYTLLNAPAGMYLTNGNVVVWTPTEAQGPTNLTVTMVVTDNQVPPQRGTNYLLITVNEINVPHVLPAVAATNYFITPGTFTLVDTATDADLPANALFYTLLDAPVGAIISSNGVITWTPDTNQAPSTNYFRIVVRDNNPYALTNQSFSFTNEFYLVVSVGSNAPTFSLMQYNVKGNGAPDWTTNAAQVAAIGRQILYLQPDVITFNEIPVAFTNQMANWALAFGYNIAVSPGNDGVIGVAIASKHPFTRTHSWLDGVSLVPFGYSGNFTRDLFEAEILIPGFSHPVHVFTTHLKSSASGYADAALKRAAEAAAITNFFTTNLFALYPNDYYTLSGDMNEADTNTLAIQRLVASTGLQMTTPVNPYSGSANTFSIQSPPPSSRIDYILPCGALASNILSSQVFRTDLVAPTPTNFNAGDDALASDHLPVLMTFRDPTFVVSNLAPVFIGTPESTNVAPLTTFSVTNLATDSDLPPQTITYSLFNAPSGMTIDANTAVITWTPAANQLGTFTIGTIATDNGSPVRSTTNYFQLFVIDFANIQTNIVAFPGAEGAGAYAVGGRAGSVYHVTTLINDGPGSLRYGLRAPNRTIVFDVSGTIELTSDLKINRSYITIAGQTAPGDGITLSRRLTSVQDNHDVQVRFIRCRPGDYFGTNFQNDSFHFDKVTNCIADHVSASWSIDETLSCTESRDVTVQWSMITDSLNNSFHEKGAHGYGSLIRYGDGKITYHHNLYADHDARSPRLGDNLTLDFVNNVVYNWGDLPGYSGTNANDILDNPFGFTNRLNYVGNYAVAGSNSSQRVSSFVGFTTNTWVYSASNRIDSALDGSLNGTNSDFGLISGAYTPVVVPFAMPPPAVTTEDPATAYERVMSFAGASRVRDSVDQNILNKVINQTGVIIDSQTQVGGWPILNSLTPAPDSDQDGMPDYWETTLGQTAANNAADGPLNSGTGYTYLENYLNWLAAPHALVLHDDFVDVDLKLIAGNTVAQSFSVSGASNGVVVLQGDGHTARFTPTTNYSGFAAFSCNVTNGVTGVGFGPVPVSVLVSTISFPTNTTTVTNPPVVISSTSFNATNGFTLNWTAPVTSQFQVQWTTNLVPVISWTSFTNTITSTNGSFTFTDDGTQSGGFTNAPHYYRLLTLP